MFKHDLIIITPDNHLGKKRISLIHRAVESARKQIREAEDKEIFRILDEIASGNKDI